MLLARDGRWTETFHYNPAIPPEMLTVPPALGVRSFPAIPLIWDLSRDGALALSTRDTRPRDVTLGNAGTKHVDVVLQHPAFNLYVPFFSPDDRWIVVSAINGVDPPRLFAVPFHPPYPIPVSEWVDLGEGIFARWAPSGNRIYFLRHHLGSRCIYTRALDPLTMRPVSDAVAVMHMHGLAIARAVGSRFLPAGGRAGPAGFPVRLRSPTACPRGPLFVSAAATAGSCTKPKAGAASGKVTCTAPSLANGSGFTVSMVVKVTCKSGKTVADTASVGSLVFDPTNNPATATTAVN